MALVPLRVTTVTSTVPSVCAAGEVAVTCVGETTVKLVACWPPKLTALVPMRLVPVIVTVVPPPGGPATGLTEVTLGVDS